ncbi:T9SS type A sorting domain-containing protein [Flavivirga algicola]|uniref:T9SS type A sorting domain-containing protein n=1 Tax=Flavivirga algicola TaxID=2729136 RepID=A0ABX1RWB2_9FLAO|nr:T9SS type A sorting domain-containing protein [Flavivirga algicola]NMH86722.1 T9SS type A sorting domain-containing protein [Flavivirga algicola]
MKKIKKVQLLIAFFTLIFSFHINSQTELYIATNGSDNNDGSINNPLATLSAAVEKSVSTGAKTIWIKEGTYTFDQRINLTSQHSGLKISGYQNDKVIFDGGTNINPNNFSLVEDDLSGRIKSSVVDKLYSAQITDTELIELLKNPNSLISFNGKALNIARFPNEGFAVFRKEQVINGNESVNTTGTYEDPKGPVFKLRSHTYDIDAWEKEIIRNKKLQMKGYTSALWLNETALVATVKSNGDYIRLVNGTAYGIETREVNRLKKVYFTNILYELDTPGEWFFDEIDNKLYVYPTSPISENSEISLWTGTEFIYIDSASDITIEKLQIQNLGTRQTGGDGAINVRNSCSHIKIAGIVFRNVSNMTSINFWPETSNSIIQSCDFIDSDGVRFYGGGYDNNSAEAGNNVMENCHYTVIDRKDFYGKACAIKGVANTFRNNLIHNTNGQPFTFYGLDHVIEKNEVFNTGVEEGDGGSMYGGNGLFTFNNTFRHNFYHHMMTFPGDPLGRAGIHFDDWDAGDLTHENVFFRGGQNGIKMGSGGQHKIHRNIVMGSDHGIKNSNRLVDDPIYANVYNDCMDFLVNDPESTNKKNYIGRALKVVGINGWQTGLTADNWIDRISPFWENRYPRFAQLMNDYFANKKMLPYGCDFSDNYFYDNNDNFDSPTGIPNTANSTDIDLGIFTNPNALNFSYNGTQPAGYPNIPFDQIGLYKDDYRCDVPDKNVYRKAVKDYFADRLVFQEPYDDATVNQLTYFNSGKVVYETIYCLNTAVGDDSYTVKAIGETCVDKANGQIKIQAKDSGTYIANLDGGADINFTNEWTIEDLVPGSYELCITNTVNSATQCYGLDIESGTSVTGKASTNSKEVAIEIAEGTLPFEVLVNNEIVLQTSSRSFSVNAKYGDVIKVKTSVDCEGVFTKTMDGIVSVSPNPTKGDFVITLSMPLKNVTIEVYNMFSQLVSSKVYPVNNGKAQLDINGKPAGIYFASIKTGSKKPKVLKIIKE